MSSTGLSCAASLQELPQLDSDSLRSRNISLCASTVPSGTKPGPKLDPNQSSDLYSKGLAAAASQWKPAHLVLGAKQSLSCSAGCRPFMLQTAKHSQHCAIGLASLPHPALAPKPCWVPHSRWRGSSSPQQPRRGQVTHCKRVGSAGQIRQMESINQARQPTHSTQIRNMLKGYSNHAAELACRKLGAVPLSEDKMRGLLCNMLQQLSTASGSEQLLLIRDGLLLSLLWQSCFRGFDAGSVRLSNITLPAGESTVSYLYPLVKLAPNSKVHIIPDSTKNKKGGHCSLTLSCDELCFASWLQLAIHSYHAAGQPITNFLTRPLLKGTKDFVEEAMSCSNTWARLTGQLKAQGIYTGQSVHSTRRGKMMHQLQQKQITMVAALLHCTVHLVIPPPSLVFATFCTDPVSH